MDLSNFSVCFVCVLLLYVHGLPLEKQTKQSSRYSDFKNVTTKEGIRQDLTTKNPEAPPIMNHTFIKFDSLRNRKMLSNEETLKLRGFSSMRMLSPAEIDHPSFDPNNFLRAAGNENAQHIEILPVLGEPYFMFVPHDMLKNGEYKDGLFSTSRRHRVKRHHPNLLQNVLGELQNFALVPIKSSNGQIRYILLKNPKFVIGTPRDNGQSAPTIVQLNSNRAVSTSNGQIRYTPKAPAVAVTKPPYRRTTRLVRYPPLVPTATSIDSIFTRGTKETVQSSSTETKTSKQSSKTSIKRMIPSSASLTDTKVASNPASRKSKAGASPNAASLIGGEVAANDVPQKSNIGLIPESALFTNLEPVSSAASSKSTIGLRTESASPQSASDISKKVLSDLTKDLIKGNIVANDIPSPSQIADTLLNTPNSDTVSTKTVGTKDQSSLSTDPLQDVLNLKDVNEVIAKAKTVGVEGLSGTGEIGGVQLKVENKSISGKQMTSSVDKQSRSDSAISMSSAKSNLTNIESNSTNLDHKNISNIKLVKEGDNHKLIHTELVETKVDIDSNLTDTKTDKGNSDVVKVANDPGKLGHGHGETIEAASIQTEETDKASAGKQANVVKKTKKTTTITLTSPTNSTSGKPEISEIQHTVEEVLHHNTSETAAAEIASKANVETSVASAGADPHAVHEINVQSKGHENNSSTTEFVDSKSTVKKAVKKTVITKTPDSNAAASDVGKSSVNQTTGQQGGFKTSVEQVEEIIQETSQTSKQTSNQSSSSSDTAHP